MILDNDSPDDDNDSNDNNDDDNENHDGDNNNDDNHDNDKNDNDDNNYDYANDDSGDQTAICQAMHFRIARSSSRLPVNDQAKMHDRVQCSTAVSLHSESYNMA